MSYKKFLVAADNHGCLVSEEAKKKILDFAKSWKPNYKIHLGDLWDFSPLRRGCSPEEKADGISEDYQMGLEFLDAFKPDYLTLGNHDDRIWMNSTKCADGMLREHCAKLAQASEDEFRKRKIKWVPYHISKYLMLPEGGPRLSTGSEPQCTQLRAILRTGGRAFTDMSTSPMSMLVVILMAKLRSPWDALPTSTSYPTPTAHPQN